MTALTKNRDTPSRSGSSFEFPVYQGANIFQGSMVFILATTNYAQPAYQGGTAGTGRVLGIAIEQANNSAGLVGAIKVKVGRGCFKFATDNIPLINNIGLPCYAIDDQTVSVSNGGGTRALAGIIRDIEPDGIWVDI